MSQKTESVSTTAPAHIYNTSEKKKDKIKVEQEHKTEPYAVS